MATKKHKRVLIKISGEALQWSKDHGIDPDFIHDLAKKISRIKETWVEIAIVLGWWNIFRWISGAADGMDRTPADYMGMLATVMNGIAFQDALEWVWVKTRLMSALNIPQVAEQYIQQKASRHLEKGRIVILVAGTGNPYFTTDSAGTLRALELECTMMIKATKVDGVYNKDVLKVVNLYKPGSILDAIEGKKEWTTIS